MRLRNRTHLAPAAPAGSPAICNFAREYDPNHQNMKTSTYGIY